MRAQRRLRTDIQRHRGLARRNRDLLDEHRPRAFVIVVIGPTEPLVGTVVKPAPLVPAAFASASATPRPACASSCTARTCCSPAREPRAARRIHATRARRVQDRDVVRDQRGIAIDERHEDRVRRAGARERRRDHVVARAIEADGRQVVHQAHGRLIGRDRRVAARWYDDRSGQRASAPLCVPEPASSQSWRLVESSAPGYGSAVANTGWLAPVAFTAVSRTYRSRRWTAR